MNNDIFISYSRKDLAIVDPIVNEINARLGIQCWIDRSGIAGGAQFVKNIRKAIDDCKIIIFMHSSNSLTSEWAMNEILYAKNAGKKITPVIIEGDSLQDWAKLVFASTDYIVISKNSGLDKLINNLSEGLGIQNANIVIKEIKKLLSRWKQYKVKQTLIRDEIITKEKSINNINTDASNWIAKQENVKQEEITDLNKKYQDLKAKLEAINLQLNKKDSEITKLKLEHSLDLNKISNLNKTIEELKKSHQAEISALKKNIISESDGEEAVKDIFPQSFSNLGNPSRVAESLCKELVSGFVEHRSLEKFPYSICKYLITQAQWQAVMGENPSLVKGATLPVTNVRVGKVLTFINIINREVSSQGIEFMLPTEKCQRSEQGYMTLFEKQITNNHDDYCWYKKNSQHKIHMVGQKKPVQGIYDALGLVYELRTNYANSGYLYGGDFNSDKEQLSQSGRAFFHTFDNQSNIGIRLIARPIKY